MLVKIWLAFSVEEEVWAKKQYICPITYKHIEANQKYSKQGIRKLSPILKNLIDLPYTVEQQLIEARKRVDKMSIHMSTNLKISARLNTKAQTFELCDIGGNYILNRKTRMWAATRKWRFEHAFGSQYYWSTIPWLDLLHRWKI